MGTLHIKFMVNQRINKHQYSENLANVLTCALAKFTEAKGINPKVKYIKHPLEPFDGSRDPYFVVYGEVKE